MTKRYFFICVGIFLSNALYGLDNYQEEPASDTIVHVGTDYEKHLESRLKNCQETGKSLVKDLIAYSDQQEREKALLEVLTQETGRLAGELEKREQALSEKYAELEQQIDELQKEAVHSAKKRIIVPFLGSFGAGAAAAILMVNRYPNAIETIINAWKK